MLIYNFPKLLLWLGFRECFFPFFFKMNNMGIIDVHLYILYTYMAGWFKSWLKIKIHFIIIIIIVMRHINKTKSSSYECMMIIGIL